MLIFGDTFGSTMVVRGALHINTIIINTINTISTREGGVNDTYYENLCVWYSRVRFSTRYDVV